MQQPCSDYNDSCSNIIYQTVDVGLPVSLTPVVDVGDIKIKCCSKPTIEIRQSDNCTGRFELLINQTVTYKIPIEYSVKYNSGDISSKCDCRPNPNNQYCY